MLKPAFVVLVLVVLGVGGFFLFQSFQTKPTSEPELPPLQTYVTPGITPTPSPSDPCEVLTKGSSDVPPLYKEGVTWQQPKITVYEVSLAEDARKVNGCLVETNDLEFSKATQVRSFYASEMPVRNWNNISSSDLPGESGSDTWNKDSKYLQVKIMPLNKPNVQLTLFYSQ